MVNTLPAHAYAGPGVAIGAILVLFTVKKSLLQADVFCFGNGFCSNLLSIKIDLLLIFLSFRLIKLSSSVATRHECF